MNRGYRYTARTAEGAFVAGTFDAATAEEALAHLRARSLFITAFEPVRAAAATPAALATMLPVDRTERMSFFRSMATLVAAGVALDRALDVTGAQCRDARLREALRSIAADVRAGLALSTALGRRPGEFSTLVVALVRAGELSGHLDETLERLAELVERMNAMRRRIAAALAYPCVVVAAAIALVVFLVAQTVPTFVSMFAELHAELPLSTRLLIGAGTLLRLPAAWLAIVAVLAIAVVGVRRAYEEPRIAGFVSAGAYRLPYLGSLFKKTAAARVTRTLGTLLHAGVPMRGAIAAVADVMGRGPYARFLVELGEAVTHGRSLPAQFEGCSLFEPVAVQLIRVGDETGRLDAMLLRIASYLELDVETALAGIGAIVEPLIIVVLGAVVGTIVASILLPLYSIIGSIT